MKIIIPLLCTLFLLGCNNTASTQESPTTQTSDVIAEDTVTTPKEEPQAVVPEVTEEPVIQAKVDSLPAEAKPVNDVKSEPKKAVAPKVVKEAKKPAEIQEKHAGVDASALYGTKCASCHGAKAEKPALGKSQVIAGWSASKIEEALHGYQAGTYGKEMKGLMAGQAKALSSDEIKALAKHISAL